MNFIIDVDSDCGIGKWRILMPCTMAEDGRRVSRWILGDHDEEYIRFNGVWLFKKIDFWPITTCPSMNPGPNPRLCVRVEQIGVRQKLNRAWACT